MIILKESIPYLPKRLASLRKTKNVLTPGFCIFKFLNRNQFMKTSFAIIIALFITSCSSPEQKKENSSPVAIKNGDVEIAYTKAGDGDTTILFVHGWSINKSFWQRQV